MKVMVSMTKFFFDRDTVRSKLTKKRHRALANAGAFTQKTARNSLKRRKGPSQPGKQPHVHTKAKYVTLKNIQYAFDPNDENTIVGPIGLVDHITGEGAIPGVLERGAMVSHPNERRTKRRVGGGGEVAIDEKRRKRGETTRDVIDYKGVKHRVVFTRLETENQVRRADDINEQLYGPDEIHGNIEARPFMGPAIEVSAPKFPEIYLREGT